MCLSPDRIKINISNVYDVWKKSSIISYSSNKCAALRITQHNDYRDSFSVSWNVSSTNGTVRKLMMLKATILALDYV